MDFPNSHDALAYLQLQYQRLELQLKSEIEARQSAERGLTSAKQSFEETTATIMQLALENEELKSDMEAKDGYTDDLRRRFKELQGKQEVLVQDLKTSEGELQLAQSEAATLRGQLEAQAGEASDDRAFLALKKETSLRLSLAEDVNKLSAKVKKLKKEAAQQEPLVKIGIDVRLRFLAQAKECIWYQKRDKLDKNLHELGNRAAHGGNGEADASLFTLDAISDSQLKSMTKVYKDLYSNSPTIFPTDLPQVREVINHKVTILTLKSLNESLHRPIRERERTMENIQIVVEKCAKLKEADLVAEDTDIARRIDLIKTETAVIVELDRQSWVRPSISRENRRTASSY